MQALLEQISKDKEKFIAFLQYLIDTGRLTEEEVINIVRQFGYDDKKQED
ncbi:hypothetical protein [Desulforamulus ferrireducens]|nr:hypothetical protein [Desulforamulus ferrireducens]